MSTILKEYKKAIKIQYETKKNGMYFDYLCSPSRGKLRDLCWLIFEKNPTQDDLNVFRNLSFFYTAMYLCNKKIFEPLSLCDFEPIKKKIFVPLPL